MKKAYKTILLILMILIVTGVALMPYQANAACASFVGFNFRDCLLEGVANIGDILLTITSYFVTVTATLLSFSIKLTLNIKQIYDSVPAIQNVWVIIRNLSSIFIIFALLYYSIAKILGFGSSNLGTLIKNIVIAGLLINFSLFFTKVAVDASNLVSLSFYRAIAPEYASQGLSKWDSSYYDGGLSNIFQASLKLQKIYDPKNSALKNNTNGSSIFGSIIIATFGGIILMLFAAISFFGAAVAFSIRTGLLLLLMAFSPLYFVGMILPTIKSGISDKWLDYLKKQLLFMPIYLILMYVSLRIISDKGFLSFLTSDGTIVGSNQGNFLTTQMGIIIQYFIAILFINAPLIAAIKFGAMGSEFASNMVKGLKNRIYKTPAFVGRNTIQRAASRISRSEGFQNFAAKSLVGEYALKGTRSISQGYDKKLTEKTQARESFAKSLDRNKTAAVDYADRLSHSLKTRYFSTFGTIGRANRVAAAKILRTRLADQETDINKLNKELAGYQAVLARGNPLTTFQQERFNKLTGVTTPLNPRGENEITEQQTSIDDTKRQMADFESAVGEKARKVEKRNY